MLRIIRYGLLPIAFHAAIVVVSMIHIVLTNAAQKRTWPQTAATVIQSRDVNQFAAEAMHSKSTFPDPYGSVQYYVDGKMHVWQGRGRSMGVTAMIPGEKINIHYNPKNPQEISTLIPLGASTGYLIFTGELAFLIFYVWFFWFRPRSGGSGPHTLDDAPYPSSAGHDFHRSSGAITHPVARSAKPFGKRRP